MATIITYHHVGAPERFPAVPAITVEAFARQLDFIASTYSVWPLSRLVDHVIRRKPMPDDVCCLTFDDGLRSQYTVAFPALLRRGWSGAFFASTDPLVRHEPADVLLIQCLLALHEPQRVLLALRASAAERSLSDWLDAYEASWRERPDDSRFNSGDRLLVKRLLQRDLPEEHRRHIVRTLFEEFVGLALTSMVEELYFNSGNVEEMTERGMEIGGHGASHRWLPGLDETTLLAEVHESFQLVSSLVPSNTATFCYPYGAFDTRVQRVVQAAGFSAAVSTESKPCSADVDHLAIPRFDTVDIT